MVIFTKDKLMSKPFAPPLPHVVILGAGASKAALPFGDKSRKIIPLLDDLPEILGNDWTKLVKKSNPPEGNFEANFSWIRKKGEFCLELSNIETLIKNYFLDLELPDNPTIYDYLVLGLREKDVIASFNWDPFLMQAHRRNRNVGGLPDIRFLHGCVSFRTCPKHDVLGGPYEVCPECNCALIGGRLFFPDEDKDYTKDDLIYRDWLAVKKKLQKAFHLTIFGYSGPATDFNARNLLLDGWKQTPVRDISHVEIIDINDPDILRDSWSEFFPHYHSIVESDFWNSSIALWPRRTAEWKISASRDGIPSEYIGPFRSNSLIEVQNWFRQLAETEVVNTSPENIQQLHTPDGDNVGGADAAGS
jgi:hypothetical protein